MYLCRDVGEQQDQQHQGPMSKQVRTLPPRKGVQREPPLLHRDGRPLSQLSTSGEAVHQQTEAPPMITTGQRLALVPKARQAGQVEKCLPM